MRIEHLAQGNSVTQGAQQRAWLRSQNPEHLDEIAVLVREEAPSATRDHVDLSVCDLAGGVSEALARSLGQLNLHARRAAPPG